MATGAAVKNPKHTRYFCSFVGESHEEVHMQVAFGCIEMNGYKEVN